MRQLTFFGGYNNFTAYIVVYMMFFGEGNQFPAAIHAIFRFIRARLVINTGVNNPRIPPRLVCRYPVFFF